MADLNKVNFMSKERFDNLSVTNDDELYLVETNVAVDEEVVHKVGNETIAGNKSFSNNIVVTGTTTLNNALTVNSNETVNGTLQVNNQKIIIANTTSSNYGGLLIKNSENANAHYNYNRIELMPLTTDSYGGYIDFHYAGSSNDYTARLIESASGDITYDGSQRDTASNSTTLGTLAVKGWVNDPAKSTNVVHRSGNETINGRKTFAQTTFMQGSNDMSYVIKSINSDNNTETQSVQTLASFRNIDNNGLIIGDVRFQKGTNGTTTSMLIARNYYGSSSEIGVNAVISCAVDNEGNTYTSAPTPVSPTDNSTQIATTAWVNNFLTNNKTEIVGLGMPNLATKTEYTSNGSTTLELTLNKRMFVSLFCGVYWNGQSCAFKVDGVEVVKALYTNRPGASFNAILEAGSHIVSWVSTTGSNYDMRIVTYDLKG